MPKYLSLTSEQSLTMPITIPSELVITLKDETEEAHVISHDANSNVLVTPSSSSMLRINDELLFTANNQFLEI